MTSVAVVEKDQALRSLVVRELALRGYDVASFSSHEDAIERACSGAVDIWVSRLHGDDEGWGLLSTLNEKVPHVRPIMMAGEDVWSQSERAQALGAVEVLPYPLQEGQLVGAVERAENSCAGFCGWVHGVSLIDLLQIFHYGRRTLTLSIEPEGMLHFENGEIVDARFRDAVGEEAVRAVLQLDHGRIRTSDARGEGSTVDRPFQSLLLDCLREMDESAKERGAGEKAEGGQSSGAAGAPSEVAFSSVGSEVPRSLVPPVRPSLLPGHNPHVEMLGGVCRDLTTQVDGAGAVMVLNLTEGRAMASVGFDAPGALDAAMRVVRRLFEVRVVGELEFAMGGCQPAESGALDEVRLATRNAMFLVRKIPERDVALLLVTNPQTPSAVCWAELRQAAKTVERIIR